jgi:excisionase family DNA binding protein
MLSFFPPYFLYFFTPNFKTQVMDQEMIIQKLSNIETMLQEQNLLKKDVLNLNEACRYLDMSASHLYKMTSQKLIPHFCPQGKKLYFNRLELDEWLQRNRQTSTDEIETIAANYLLTNRRK